MNRPFFAILAVGLSTALVQTAYGQAPLDAPPAAYPTNSLYATQPAVYMNVNPAPMAAVHPAAIHPAMVAGGAPGVVPASACDSCGPLGCDADGCDSTIGCDPCGAGCGGGLLGRCRLFSGCGLFGGCGDACGDTCGGGCSGLGGGGLLGCGAACGPYGSGGCCLPRWYDVQAEWLFWKRRYDDDLAFSSDGILGPDALNANQLDFSEESGVRLTGAYMLGVAGSVEVGYFGMLNWASAAHVTSDGNLFSVFSDFGSNPLNGFPETGFGLQHGISLSSELDNAEINYRHRWVSASCLFHGSVLAGARYFRLQEDLLYDTLTDVGSMDYHVKTDNDLVGAQLGGDLFVAVTSRLRVGAEVEAGIYGASSKQRTRMFSTNSPSLAEDESDTDVAFIGEAGVMALFRINSQLSFRAGYQVLYIDGVALAMDNFNTASPFSIRDSFLNNRSDVLYHGATLGFEWAH